MLWLMGALALSATFFLFMPVYFGKIPDLSRAMTLTVKTIPTLLASLFALVAFLRSSSTDRYALLLFVGLCICAAADYLLGVHFPVGGAAFFVGHMFYLAALNTCRKPTWWSLGVFVVAVAALWLFCHRYYPLFPNRLMFLGALVYCLALGALLSFSLPQPFLAPSRRAVLAALGALLFVISDMGTCHVVLGQATKQFNYMSLGIYYTAQFLLGMSAFA